MDQLTARELINNGWFVISLCLVFVFGGFLLKEMREDGWYPKLRNQAAISLLIYFIGETLARGWGALLLYKMSTGEDMIAAFAVEQRYPLALAGAAISFVGAVCCVRVFSPASWGHKAWLVVVAIAAAFMTATYVF